MNLTFEAILSIFILIVFLTPLLYLNNFDNSHVKDYWWYYYNKVKYNESFRKCLVKENCKIEGVYSYNCSNNKIINLPKKSISFLIIGYKSYYCPTLVIFDLENYK